MNKQTKSNSKGNGGVGMFKDLLENASMPDEYYLPDSKGKIQAFEDAFGDDKIKKTIAYDFSSSHEYNDPKKKILAVKSCIKFVNNYDWKETELPVEKIESFNKPLNMKKVYDIAKSIEEKGEIQPLIVVNKIHGLNWQSKGKLILTDGNHRYGALKMLEIKKTPVFYGVYTGNAEMSDEEFLSNNENDSISESINEEIALKVRPYLEENYIPNEFLNQVSSIKNFFIENAKEYKLLKEGVFSRIKFRSRSEIPDKFYNTVKKVIGSIKNSVSNMNHFEWYEDNYENVIDNAKARNKNSVSVAILSIKGNDNEKIKQEYEKIKEKLISSLKSSGMIIENTDTTISFCSSDNTVEGHIFVEDSPFKIKFYYKRIQNESENIFEGSIEKIPLTPSEREAVKEKYGNVECSFAKNKANGKYFCYTHRARSKFYDSPTDIPADVVRFISGTS